MGGQIGKLVLIALYQCTYSKCSMCEQKCYKEHVLLLPL